MAAESVKAGAHSAAGDQERLAPVAAQSARSARQNRDPRARFRTSEASSSSSTHGAPGGTRTPNLLIRSQMLYPLSYRRLGGVEHTRAGGVSAGSVDLVLGLGEDVDDVRAVPDVVGVARAG